MVGKLEGTETIHNADVLIGPQMQTFSLGVISVWSGQVGPVEVLRTGLYLFGLGFSYPRSDRNE